MRSPSLFGCPLAAVLLATSAAGAADAPATAPLGGEFVDMPEQAGAAKAAPADEKKGAGYLSGYRRHEALGLSPFAPQGYVGSAALAPPYGAPLADQAMRLSFTGYLMAPLRMGIGTRDTTAPGQSKTTLHGDPLVAGGSYGWFDMVPVVPGPWAQLNFAYGNDVVTANTVIGAWNLGESMGASGYWQAPSQVWFNDAFLKITPKTGPVGVTILAGVFPDRYGAMAEYSSGAYSTPLIATMRGIGTTATALLPFEYDLDLKLEAGFKGDLNHPPVGLIPAPSNDFASAAQGATFAYHAHANLGYQDTVALGTHFIRSFSQDDRRDGFDDPTTPQNEAADAADGKLDILGADLTVKGGRYGYLYLGASDDKGRGVEALNNLVRVQNAGGGKELMERFFGQASHGNGEILFVGGQYTVSLGTLLRYPMEYWGEGPDLTVSLFGTYGSTKSDDPAFSGKKMVKYGTELTYSLLPFLAASGRVDHVVPDTKDGAKSFSVISPKLTLRTDWLAREAVVLEYAGYLLNDGVVVNGDTRLLNNPSGRADKHMVAIYGLLSW
jgi:hypothetical protein